jgi:hypothetical protein
MLLTIDELKAAERRRQDYADCWAEWAGCDNRIPRFLSEREVKRKRRERLGIDPATDRVTAFLAQLATFNKRLDLVQQSINAALGKARERERICLENLNQVRQRATKMEDGTPVYLTADGRHAYTDKGMELTRTQKADIQWVNGAPTWEERQVAGNALNAAIREREAIESYRDRADYYRQRAAGTDLSEQELKDMQHDLDAMPKTLREEINSRHAIPAVTPSNAKTHPDLFADFDLSASDIQAIKATPPNNPNGPA